MRRIAVLAVLASFGCETEPYCLTCTDGGSGPPDGGMDASLDGASGDAASDAAEAPDGCLVAEICNEIDDDCDGTIDEGFDLSRDPAHCGACDRLCSPPHAFPICEGGMCMRGDCDIGWYDLNMDPSDGCEYRCAGIEPDDAICNLRDDDCDGMVDEDVDLDGDPVNCGRCGHVCAAPHSTSGCVLGVCSLASCDAGFHDLDGRADNGCEYACTAATPPVEVCNSRDDDCDGTVDEGNPGGGATCGGPSTLGECALGMMACRGGALVCEGGVGPTPEICNTLDDDCDGSSDEDFALMTDIRNCGSCGTVCALPHATQSCVGGVCAIGACERGFVDLDPGVPGCEYMCSFSGDEICNGLDDDCNGMIDDGFAPPAGYCNPNGVCAGTSAVCSGATGWTCTYPSTFETPETTCDGLDNDCDGVPDEGYLELGSACSNGMGACRTTGMYVCNASRDGVTCTAPPAGTPADEECNGLDDDCDGLVDERVVDDPGTAWRDGVDVDAIDTVTVDLGGASMRMMAYEASRPDATSMAGGALEHIACSRPNVVPWVNVTWDEAQAACCALNPSGTCPGMGGSGWRLCEAADWETGCDGPVDVCTHSYASMCTTSQRTTCNGAEHDCDPGTPGDQDCLYNTGSATFPMCYTDWGAAGHIYDLSGNVREWTATGRGADLFEVRGGSMNHIEPGRSCQWSFTVAQRTTAAPNTGFRCCLY